ncbi:MAG TPA: hypothetical protein VGR98_21065 [Streptosporangiaceae bacterium]|nr:hypothetical protein [Streptosporangiaceae bacterium]
MTDGAGLEVDFGLRIAAGVGEAVRQALGDFQQAERRRRARLNEQIMPLNIDLQPIPLVAGNGVLDQPRLLQPAMGWTWQLDGMGAQGFTAGTVTVFLNSVQGAQLFTFTTAGVFYQRHFRFMRYGERLVFQAAGITVSATQPFGVWVAGLAFTDALQGEVLV